MRLKALALTALAALTVVSLTASHPATGKVAMSAGKATLVGVEEMKWADVPGTPAKMATVKGDAAKGANSSFIRLPGGFTAPLHSHTADHQVAIISGTLVLTPEGGTEKRLGPGSWFEFTGKRKHVTTCVAGADCVLFLVSKGAWDLVPADAPKKK